MVEAATKVQVKTEETKAAGKVPEPTSALQEWRPFESLRKEVDRLFDDFGHGFLRAPFRRSMFDIEPFWRREISWAGVPAVDIAEKDDGYEITAELPGMDEKNIEVRVSNGTLVVKGEKKEEKEEKKKDYYLSERHYGSFERRFPVPDAVDAEKIAASFKKGVLTVTLPKKAEAKKPAKTIEVKAAA